ncbi:phosphohydrolase [Methanomicrobiaceae archaeon CYW5]|uniref:deoxyguanosinetriphosphate triphosphohydrolase family protein n=1 Tax=Methanovulcanius yangii TaxID=1789227 RepID=UPI0029CA9A28|nr:HD domain-containing protein [Methanovulcanius yangii]MBT8508453.1 phosphohydrolase [Methanovulcanius yangii]
MNLSDRTLTAIAAARTARDDLLSPRACRDGEALRRRGARPEEPILRPPFFRDADRIIHSRAFSRYIDKTQVFYLLDNEHITHRVIHVQLAAKIARTIGRALGLNEDLIEAAALGHDIGHTPFGHLGESYLSTLCEAHGIGRFSHNVQSVRFLDDIERCDLTLQVLDAILCHDGERHVSGIVPDGCRTWEGFEAKRVHAAGGGVPVPATAEGAVVRFADTIAYLGRDLQDAVEVDLIPRELPEFPAKCRGIFRFDGVDEINGIVIDTFARDIIEYSAENDAIGFSPEVADCLGALKDYNYAHIYENPVLHAGDHKIERMFSLLFDTFLADLEDEREDSFIYKDFIRAEWVAEEYITAASNAELVRDYIAGMTDKYFLTLAQSALMPERRFRTFNISGSSP